jgi:hypothetical protein
VLTIARKGIWVEPKFLADRISREVEGKVHTRSSKAMAASEWTRQPPLAMGELGIVVTYYFYSAVRARLACYKRPAACDFSAWALKQ